MNSDRSIAGRVGVWACWGHARLALVCSIFGLEPGSVPAAVVGPGGADSTNAPRRTALEVRQIGSNTFQFGGIEFDKAQRTVSLPARVRMRHEVVEYALVAEQGKAYESLLTTGIRPLDLHLVFLLLGMGPATVAGDPNTTAPVPATNALGIEVAWETNGRVAQFALSDLISVTSGKPDPAAPALSGRQWLYNGSVLDRSGFAAQREGSIISLIRDPAALINNPGPDRDNDSIHFPNAQLLPEAGTPVRVIIRLPNRSAAGAKASGAVFPGIKSLRGQAGMSLARAGSGQDLRQTFTLGTRMWNF